MKLIPISDIIIAKIAKVTQDDFKTKGGIIVANSGHENTDVKYERSQNVAEVVAFGEDVPNLFGEKAREMLKVGAKIFMNGYAYQLIDSGDVAKKMIIKKSLGVEKLFDDEDNYQYIYFSSKDLFGFWVEE